ncbi:MULTISPECIES: hypothetical protein [unclassified Azospirillum]|uniref:hypothetical protein n=1 Tax=unclassified Azospirillum TaxID=2630922 RepID=UPI000B722F3D|nr:MULTISPECIES: hypothetical protein [unclassified Azospirillum]SNR85276.1 hypothetical protein SAMN05880556_101136 [Azospirillum sp. RU38E]SNS01179.1 hypothetical protein SAMN05880591_101136 [Azospirillum sp. RU37A]
MRPMITRLALLLSLLAAPAALAQTSTVREEIQVSVAGRPETWRLVWDGPTRPFCGLDDLATADTGPCNGFAYGEQGALFLERRGADGGLLDRLGLGPAFRDSDLAGLDIGNAALPRWPVQDRDGNLAKAGAPEIAAFTARVQARPPVPIMALADYDGDGKALEFLFQTNVLPTSKQYYAAAGIDPTTGRLHLLHSTARPDRALVLSKAAWQALARGGPPAEVPFWACDDHGADIRQTYWLAAQKGQISVTIRDYDCASSALQKEEAW